MFENAQTGAGMGLPRYVGPQAPVNDVERVLAIDALTNRVSCTHSDLRECISALEKMADSLVGPTPPTPATANGSGANVKMANVNRVQRLDEATRYTDDLVRMLRVQIERFSAL